MQVKSFKEWDIDVNEMARDNNISGNSLERSSEWDNVVSSSKFTKLISDEISANKYNLYQYGNNTFYLTDINNTYLGHIELDSNNHIDNTYSNIKGGFYNLMFTQIFANTPIKSILSDTSLSAAAINSYEKLSKNTNYKINIKTDTQILPFDKDVLLSNDDYRVIITEHISSFKVNCFINKIHLIDESINYPGFYRQKWLSNDPFCDMWLYGETIN